MIDNHTEKRLMVSDPAPATQREGEKVSENVSILAGFIHITASLCGLVSQSIIFPG